MVALLIVLALAAIYGGAYYLNSKTPVPKGAEEKLENCHGCKISSCELHPTHRETEV